MHPLLRIAEFLSQMLKFLHSLLQHLLPLTFKGFAFLLFFLSLHLHPILLLLNLKQLVMTGVVLLQDGLGLFLQGQQLGLQLLVLFGEFGDSA